MTRQIEGHVDLASGELAIRAGFRVTTTRALAGGPIELCFSVRSLGAPPLFLSVRGDRMRLRPADFSFSATLCGTPLVDPGAAVPDMGGPASVVQVSKQHPWVQPLILNEYVALERAPERLDPGASALLDLTCRRPLPLAHDKRSALIRAGDEPWIEVQLAIQIHRDDEELIGLVDALIGTVQDGPIEQRVRTLDLLLALRAPIAVARWRTLVDHRDASVAERVRRSVRALSADV